MAVDVTQIQTDAWSMNVSQFGEVVTNVEDIRQCINIIVCTAKGDVPLLRNFGCGLYDWIDQPVTIAAPKMARDIKKAILAWEKRVRSVEVTYSFENVQSGHVIFTLTFSIVSGIGLRDDPLGTKFLSFVLIGSRMYLVDEQNRYILTDLGFLIV